MLNALDFAPSSYGPASDRELTARASSSAGSTAVDRASTRDESAGTDDKTANFEGSLMALAAAGAASSPCAPTPSPQPSGQPITNYEASSSESGGTFDVLPSVNTTLDAPVQHAVEGLSPLETSLTTGLPGSMEKLDKTAVTAAGSGEASSRSGGPVDFGAIAGRPLETGSMAGQTAPEKLQTNVPSGNKVEGQLALQIPGGNSENVAQAVNDSALNVDEEGVTPPANLEIERSAIDVEVQGGDSLFQIHSKVTDAVSAGSSSDASGDDADSQAQSSDQPGGFVGADSLLATSPVIERTDIPVIHQSGGSEPLAGPTVAEQIFGEISARAEISNRDGKIDFRMRLDPPGLGTVHVHLTASENFISAQLVVDDPAARQAIESQLHTLREALAGLGVSLEHSGLSHEGGGSSGTWDWHPPEPTLPAVGASAFRSAKRSSAINARREAGGIDMVV